MAIREIHVWARYINDSTGKEYWSTKEEDSCFIEKYSSSSEFVGLKVTPEERLSWIKNLQAIHKLDTI